MIFKDKLTQWGMLAITWLLIICTLPVLYKSWKDNKKYMDSMSECEKMCYPYRVSQNDNHRCICRPEVR